MKASAGQTVKKGDVILIPEVMKVEYEVVASQVGTIAGIDVAVGDSVETGAVLASMESPLEPK